MDSCFSEQDELFMREALRLAEKGSMTTTPNPNVGCVIVKDDEIVGRGFHIKAGDAHAEVFALNEAGKQAQGSTAYVTLEPCSHYGRTPPCALRLIDANVKRVVIATTDLNPLVSGQGIKQLQEAGIIVDVGLLQEQAQWLNRDFFTRIKTGRPYVTVKMGSSLDGKIAMSSGQSQWITSKESRRDVQRFRAQSSAILSTGSTVIQDHASLNVRASEFPESDQRHYPLEAIRQPIRIILDANQKLTGNETLFNKDGDIWVVRNTEINAKSNVKIINNAHKIDLISDSKPHQIDLAKLLDYLGEQQINLLWVESGANLVGQLIEHDLVDEIVLYYAPKILGHNAKSMAVLPNLTALSDSPQFHFHSTQIIGDDLRVVLVKKYN